MEVEYVIKLDKWEEEIKPLIIDKEDSGNAVFFLDAMNNVFTEYSAEIKKKINPDVILSPIIWPDNEQLTDLRKKHPTKYKIELGKWITFDGKDNLKITFYPNSCGKKLIRWEGKKAPPFLKPLLKSNLESRADLPALEKPEGALVLNSFPDTLYYGSIADCDAVINHGCNRIDWTSSGHYCMIFGDNFKKFLPIWNKLKTHFPKSELTQKDFLKSLNRKELRGYIERHELEAERRKGESILGTKIKTGSLTLCIIPDSYKKKPTIEYFLSDSDIAESDFFSRKKDIEKTINFFKENAKFLLEPWDLNSNHYSLKYFHLDLINKKLSDNMKLALIEVDEKSLYAGAACGLAVQHLRGNSPDVLDNSYNKMIDEDIGNAARKYRVEKTKLTKLYSELSQRKEAREK
jgi:hypothetical protein